MDIPDANTNDSECEMLSEHDLLSTAKTTKGKSKKPPKAVKPSKPEPDFVSDSVPKTGNKRRSIWWTHYTESGDVAKCIYCCTKIRCPTRSGTTPLKNHISSCQLFPENIDKKQKLMSFESATRVSEDGSVVKVTVPKLWQFDQELIRRALAKMLILDELPFSFVEREGFREFCKVINAQFVVPSRATITRDCYSFFIEERRILLNTFKTMSSRVCLTTDTWTSGQNLCYMCLTAHFIDNEWRLHKRIINFCPIIGHSGVLIGRAVEKCLVEWGLKNVLTVTVDNASSNDVAVKHLQKVFHHWGGDVFKGEYLHMRCAAHILNLVVKDGLTKSGEAIKKIRALVKYVRSSPARLQKFEACVEEEEIESKSLVCMDIETRWNSTYLMLESAVKFKKAFSNLLLKDFQLVKEMKKCEGGLIHEGDWNDVDSMVPFLKIFYETTLRFSGSRYVTSDTYLDEIVGLGALIHSYTTNEDKSIQNMALEMSRKFTKYWGDINKLNQFLFIAKILDPRWKWRYIEFLVKKEYVNDTFKSSLDLNLRAMFELYSDYVPQNKTRVESSSTSTSGLSSDHGMNVQKYMQMQFQMTMGSSEVSSSRNELDKYLGEECEPMDQPLDILQWWKLNQHRYPILAKMARDVLAIPVSTVASESAFSTGGRVLDCYRTSLTPKMVEALVCAQDWLRASTGPIMIEETLLELEKMEAGSLEELAKEQPTIIIDETVETEEE